MLKTIGLFDKSATSKNNSSRSVSYKNDDSMSVFRKNDGNSEVNKFGISKNNVEYAKKSRKLFKSRNQKAKRRPSLEIWLSQKKSCQKVRIPLILII